VYKINQFPFNNCFNITSCLLEDVLTKVIRDNVEEDKFYLEKKNWIKKTSKIENIVIRVKKSCLDQSFFILFEILDNL
jgi:mevalonate pyrophosphate decarboxylase